MKVLNYILDSTRSYWNIIALMCLCVFLIALDINIRSYIIKMITDQSINFDPGRFTNLTILFLISQLMMISANTGFDWLATKFHTRYRADIVHKFFDKLSSYRYKFFQETYNGVIIAKISDAFNIIPVIIFTAVKIFINFIFFLSMSLFLLSSISIYFALGSIVWIVIFLFINILFYKNYTPQNNKFAKVRPRIYGFLSDYFSNILSVWFFNNESHERLKLKEYTNDFIDKGTKCGASLRNFYVIQGITVAIYMLLILYLLRYLAYNNRISPGDFALVFILSFKIIDLLFELASMSREFVTNWAIVENAIDLIDCEIYKNIDNKTNRNKINTKIGIIFKNVSFAYNGQDKIFDKLSVEIKPGEKVGLVGFSGSGKTTFINLLLRLYELDSGKILINQTNIKHKSFDYIRNIISLVPQDPNLFHRTIMENIRYSKLDASDDEVINAAQKAMVHDFIIRQENGYNTIVGEKGLKLSGGQRQRIAIARAILKDSPVFILDEATSQLDFVTENDIKDNLDEIVKGKTVLIVAHRFSTLSKMNRILVFDQGKIIEDGTYEELLNKNGLFTKLWNAQKQYNFGLSYNAFNSQALSVKPER